MVRGGKVIVHWQMLKSIRRRNKELFITSDTSLSTLDCEDLIHVAAGIPVTRMLCELFIAIVSVQTFSTIKLCTVLCSYLHLFETVSQIIA